MIVLAAAAWAGVAIMTILPPDRFSSEDESSSIGIERWRGSVLFSLAFVPLGCLARFYLSVKLNGVYPSFPLGTFTSNILGTARLGSGGSRCTAREAWQFRCRRGLVDRLPDSPGVMDGFCGALTTVSTWTAELREATQVCMRDILWFCHTRGSSLCS